MHQWHLLIIGACWIIQIESWSIQPLIFAKLEVATSYPQQSAKVIRSSQRNASVPNGSTGALLTGDARSSRRSVRLAQASVTRWGGWRSRQGNRQGTQEGLSTSRSVRTLHAGNRWSDCDSPWRYLPNHVTIDHVFLDHIVIYIVASEACSTTHRMLVPSICISSVSILMNDPCESHCESSTAASPGRSPRGLREDLQEYYDLCKSMASDDDAVPSFLETGADLPRQLPGTAALALR